MTAVPEVQDSPAERRSSDLRRLQSEQFDLCVVGGGITGAGIALDAVTRGLRVTLIERRDFASGTSSRTTKLIHGGLRYLAQGQARVTRDASLERRHLLRLAPHLVKPLPFMVPLRGIRDRAIMEAGLTAYDLLAGLQNVQRHYAVSRETLYQWFPLLRGADYTGGLVYYDAQTDDARLTVTVIKEAARYGACVVNHCEALRLEGSPHNDRLVCRDTLTGSEMEVHAHRIVLATGVWVDELLRTHSQKRASVLVRPAKGVHLILPQEVLGSRGAVLLRFPEDGRYVFVIPWKRRTLLGTTDTNYLGPLDDPPVTAEDVRYLLRVLNTCAPSARVSEDAVLGAQAGLRPLVNQEGKPADAVSREDRITITSEGLIVIVGGKLTTYRHIARKVVDDAVGLLQVDGVLQAFPASRTGEVALGGFPLGEAGQLGREQLLRELQAGLPEDVAEHLLMSYGAGAQQILSLVRQQSELGLRIVAELPVIFAEAIYAVDVEWAQSLSDVLTRRLGLTLLSPQSASKAAAKVASLIAPFFVWSEGEQMRQVELYRAEALEYSWPSQ
ncbi:MAG: glycerol-3-phosphate dehydrogenase/oxidase [Chloroflexi bacterium]|nr:glycerol-3-phosphate dehydrogenase/oxidase [Chloroflexota bacterium]